MLFVVVVVVVADVVVVVVEFFFFFLFLLGGKTNVILPVSCQATLNLSLTGYSFVSHEYMLSFFQVLLTHRSFSRDL